MATNKHAIIRYQALDRCFSNYGKKFFIEDLINECNKAIYDFTGNCEGIKRRQLFEDIKFMESEAGYSIPLERLSDGKKKYYRYSDKNFSINKRPLSLNEAEQLKETILMLNRFKGLPQFDWMEEVMARLVDTFKLKSNVENVVCFDQNPYLQGLNYFTILFNAIINQKVLKIYYRASFGEKQSYIIHPYFLKQYNNRWFLFGLSNGKIMNMALDRINSCEEILMPYIGNETIDFSEYFQDIVGVTMPPDKSVEKIILKIEKNRYNYIATKPFHESQTELKDLSDNKSVVIKLELIPNYEFETLLLGFADSIEILEPISLKEKICKRANTIIQMNKKSAD